MKPDDYPEIVYKYRSWTNPYHRRVLTDNEFYYAKPSDMNDPFDCQIPTDYLSLDTPEKQKEMVDVLMIRHFQTLVDQGYDLKKEMARLDYRMREDRESIQNDLESMRQAVLEKHFGIVSLSKRWDSILMWSHYGDFHRGICVGLRESKFREKPGYVGGAGPVVYNETDRFPLINPLEQDEIRRSFQESHTKAYDWHYEEEYRLRKFSYPEPFKDEERTVRFPDDFISEVLLGLRADNKTKDEIIEIAKKKKIPVFEIVPVRSHFRLDRRIIYSPS